MTHNINPYVVIGKVAPEYFCDRVVESARLVKLLTNGNNVVIISPRRMGKTTLINFCYEQPEIKNQYYTFFIDILHTSSLKEFTYVLGKEIYDTLLSQNKQMLNLFIQTLKSINGKFGFDPLTSLPTYDIELGDIIKPEDTLNEIFKYLTLADKHSIVAIGEFQQVTKYPEKHIEALLRSHMQRLENCNFIFAGSERNMMQSMFLSAARPFYNSADIIELNAIPEDIYVPFIVEHFTIRDRKIDAELVKRVYNLFQGHTYYIQKTFNEVFAYTSQGEECTVESIQNRLEYLIACNATIFREILSNIPEKQKELLYAIARDGSGERITSAEFIKSHNLMSASSVQAAVKMLYAKDIITKVDKTFSVTDKLFAMWINQIYARKFKF